MPRINQSSVVCATRLEGGASSPPHRPSPRRVRMRRSVSLQKRPSHRSSACCHCAPRAGLTLLELLAVIVILSILWAFVFPGTDAVRRGTRRREALAEAQSLATALLLYRDTYGHWPLQTVEQNDGRDIVYGTVYGTNVTVVSDVLLLDQPALIRALTPSRDPDANPDNPQNLCFLEIDSDRLVQGAFVDPWSTDERPAPYIAAVDANGDGWIGELVDGNQVRPIKVTSVIGMWTHDIPAAKEPIYVYSWSDTPVAPDRISTARFE